MDLSQNNLSNHWSSGIAQLDDLWKLNNARSLRLVKGSAGTGKSELLYQIALTSILPKRKEDLIFNGNENTVVFISNDQKVSLARIIQLFYQRIITSASHSMKSAPTQPDTLNTESDSTNIDSLLQECLSRLWIIRCKDWLQFKTSMVALPRRLAAMAKTGTTHSEKSDSALPQELEHPVTLIIDAMDTFYLLENKSSHYETTEDIVRNFLHTNSQSMVFAAVSEMSNTTNSVNSTVLTLNGTSAECNGTSRSYRIDSASGFTLS